MGFLSRFINGSPIHRNHLAARANKVTIDSSEPVGAMVRADGATYDVEREYDEIGLEQKTIWRADGSKTSCPARVKGDAVGPQASTVRDLMDPAWDRVRATGAAFDEMRERLLPFAPWRAFENKRYVITWIALMLGDIAGIFGAALSYGEIPANAFGQAVACGVAAVTAGLVGADVKNVHIAKAIRGAGIADEDMAKFGFVGALSNDSATYGLVLRMAAAVSAALVVGIFVLRMTIEGITGGLVFGGLSFAIAGASFINAWVHANPAAELLDAYKDVHENAKSDYLSLGAHPVLANEAAAHSEASLIEAEHEVRGQAAQHHVEALKWGILRRHPQILGHGNAKSPTPTTIPSNVVPLNTRTLDDRALADGNDIRGLRR